MICGQSLCSILYRQVLPLTHSEGLHGRRGCLHHQTIVLPWYPLIAFVTSNKQHKTTTTIDRNLKIHIAFTSVKTVNTIRTSNLQNPADYEADISSGNARTVTPPLPSTPLLPSSRRFVTPGIYIYTIVNYLSIFGNLQI